MCEPNYTNYQRESVHDNVAMNVLTESGPIVDHDTDMKYANITVNDDIHYVPDNKVNPNLTVTSFKGRELKEGVDYKVESVVRMLPDLPEHHPQESTIGYVDITVTGMGSMTGFQKLTRDYLTGGSVPLFDTYPDG